MRWRAASAALALASTSSRRRGGAQLYAKCKLGEWDHKAETLKGIENTFFGVVVRGAAARGPRWPAAETAAGPQDDKPVYDFDSQFVFSARDWVDSLGYGLLVRPRARAGAR